MPQLSLFPQSCGIWQMMPIGKAGILSFQRGLIRKEREKRKRDWKQQIRHAYRQKLKDRLLPSQK